MAIDRDVLGKLRKFATAFKDARERGANESDTVMFLVKMFEEVFGYDSLKGEISKEQAIKDRYCDIALKIEGTVRVLVEGKAAGLKGLVDKNIEQAENYASRAGIRWVLLTNGIEWKLYHLTWSEGEGIEHEIAFQANLLDEIEVDAESLWGRLQLLCRNSVCKGSLEDYWEHKKSLSLGAVVKALFAIKSLTAIRSQLNKNAPARLDMSDVFAAVREALSKEALMEAGEISMPRAKRRTKKVVKTDTVTGRTEEEEVEEYEEDEAAVLPLQEKSA